MKSKEELYSLKSEVELLNNKLCELSDDELAQVTGGIKLANRRSAQMLVRNQGTAAQTADVACGTVAAQMLSDIID